jgi:putative transposase
MVDTSTYHYKSRRHDQAGIEARIKDICATRVRYGYRRVHVVLRREGWSVNAKKVYRIYNELGLQLRNKTPKRRVKARLRDDRQPATQPNETWAMDFVHDQLATGKKIRVLTVVDTFSRFSPIIVHGSATALRTSLPLLSRAVLSSAIRRRSASTRDLSSFPVIWTCGRMPMASRWTSHGRASRRTMRSSKPSMGGSGLSA